MSGGSASGEAGWKPCGVERARVHRADSRRAAGRVAAVGASARGAAAGGFSGARSVSPATQSAGLRGRSPSRRRRSRSASPRAADEVLQRSATALRQHLHQVFPGPSPRVVPVWPWGVFHGCVRSVTRAHGQCLSHLSVAGAALLHAVPQDVQIKSKACVSGLCVGVQWLLSGHEGA